MLPASRRDWGDAMRAELGSIESRGERARFALSCTRVAFAQSALTQLGWHLLAAVALVIAVLADDIQYPALRNRLVGAVLVLVALSFVGSRRSPLGPVHPEPARPVGTRRRVPAGGI